MPLLRRLARSLALFIRQMPRRRDEFTPSCAELEPRDVPSGPDSPIAAFDVIKLNAMRQDPDLAIIDGLLPSQSKNIGIALVDTGLYGAHNAIRGNFKAFYQVSSGFFTTDAEAASTAQDPTGHGTHVASTAGGTNPNVSVAPGADLIGLGISGADLLGNARTALNWVLQNSQSYNIKVVNLSVRTGGDQILNINNLSQAPDPGGLAGLIYQLEGQGVTVVAASGNNYQAFEAPGAEVPAVFASLSVAATWEDNGTGERFPYSVGNKGNLSAFDKSASPDRFVSFSQRSSLPNQVAAPGATILGAGIGSPDDYVNAAGTSMAAPMVSGLVALMQDAAYTFGSRYLSVSDIVRIIRETGDALVDRPHDQNGYFDPETGQLLPMQETGLSIPRINVLKAIQKVRDEVTASKLAPDLNAIIPDATPLPDLSPSQPIFMAGNVGFDGLTKVGPNDVDLYRVNLLAPGQVSVQANLPNLVTGSKLRIFNADGQQLNQTLLSNGSTLAISADTLPIGLYYVGVSSGGNFQYNVSTGANRSNGIPLGDYKLLVTLQTADPDGTILTAQDLAANSQRIFDPTIRQSGQIVPGTLGYTTRFDGAPQWVGSADVNFYRWTAPDTGYVTINAHSITDLKFTPPAGTVVFDTFLRVFLADGTPYIDRHGTAGLNGDSAWSTDSLLRLWVDRGQTYFVAVSATGTSTGDTTPNRYDPLTLNGRRNPLPDFKGYYELSVVLDNNDSDGTPESGDLLPFDMSISSRIGESTTGALVGVDGSRDVTFYRLQPGQDGFVTITLFGENGFQPSATLWQANDQGFPAEWITSDSGSNVRWTFRVTAQTQYLMQVTGAGNIGVNWLQPHSGTGGQTGAYSVFATWRPLSDAEQIGHSTVSTSLQIRLNQAVIGDFEQVQLPGGLGYYISSVVDPTTGKLEYRPSQVQVYSFQAPYTGDVQIQLSAIAELGYLSAPVLVVYDGLGRVLNTLGMNGSGGTLTLPVQGGFIYYLGVTGRSAEATAYDIFTGKGAAQNTATAGGQYLLLVSGKPPIPPVPPVLPPSPPPPISPPVPPTNPPDTKAEVTDKLPLTPPVLPPVIVPSAPILLAPIDVSQAAATLQPSTVAATTGMLSPLEQSAFTVNTRDGLVILLDGTRTELQRITPWPNFRGEIRTTVADLNGDGFPEIIAGTGPGVSNHVAIFDGKSGDLLRSFQPFEPSFTGGVFVVAGDITGDGIREIVVTPDMGGGPRVRVYDPAENYAVIADFYGIDDANFRGGARVAIGDLNRDGAGDLFVAAGFGGGPRVAVFSGRSIPSGQPRRFVADFMVFEPEVRNGVFLTVGDLNGDGVPDLIVGGGPSSGPRVSVLSGESLNLGQVKRVADFFVGSPSSRGGVRLSIKDLDGDDHADLVTTLGGDSSGQVLGYSGKLISAGTLVPRVLATVPSFDGVYVG